MRGHWFVCRPPACQGRAVEWATLVVVSDGPKGCCPRDDAREQASSRGDSARTFLTQRFAGALAEVRPAS